MTSVRDPRQVREDLVLHPIGEVGVLLCAAQILERQDRDAFVVDDRRACVDTVHQWTPAQQ